MRLRDRIFSIARAPDGGLRVYLVGLRIHHGLACSLIAAAAIAGVVHDWPDFPWRLTDS